MQYKHFFVLLWYVSKLDHVIKSYTKMWLLDHSAQEGNAVSVAALCQSFCNKNKEVDMLHQLFDHAVTHIHKSVSHLHASAAEETRASQYTPGIAGPEATQARQYTPTQPG